jgi:RND superfamily putative drug exporter
MVRARWLVIGGWVAVVVAGAIVGGSVFDRAATVDSLGPDAESIAAKQREDRIKPEGPVVIAAVLGVASNDPGLVASVTRVANEILLLPGVYDVVDQYQHPHGQTGPDNQGTIVLVELDRDLLPDRLDAVEDAVVAVLRTIEAPRVLVGGDHLAQRAFADKAIGDTARGESIALPVLLVVLVIVAGGVLAGSIPLAVATAAVAAALFVLVELTRVTVVSEYAVNVVTLLGLGLAVDYALLLLARYREELAAGRDREDAVAVAVGAAGRAVAVSGIAVAAAMGGLWAFGQPLLAAMALGGAIVVLFATGAGLTLVPAILAVAGRRIPPAGARTWLTRIAPRRRRRVGPDGRLASSPTRRAGLLARLARFGQRHPGATCVGVVIGLLALAAPFLGANLANSDVRSLPRSMEVRQAYEVVHADFEHGLARPIVVVAEVDSASPDLLAYLNVLHRYNGVYRVDLRPELPAGATIVDVFPKGETEGTQARTLVGQIRATTTPFPVLVGGPAAELVDYRDSVVRRLPLAALVLLLTTGVLLFFLTGSLVVPVKALLANVLTLGATLGVLVVLFQWGWGGWLLGFEPWGAIDLTTPVLLFVFVFGLTMDYEVFLLARIREEWLRTADNDRAVLSGITRTGQVVTSAAFCIVVVFLGFVLGDITAVKEVGVGMTVAVALDVTVVRGLLLPSVMTLLGDLNWWAPAYLHRLRRRPQTAPGRPPRRAAADVPG